MKFKLVDTFRQINAHDFGSFYLVSDSWDDWFTFATLYRLYLVDQETGIVEIGYLKIGQLGMGTTQRTPTLANEFSALGNQFFSLGQDVSYYENVVRLPPGLRNSLLVALRDMAFDSEIYRLAQNEKVTSVSLMRYVSSLSIADQFRRVLDGGAVRSNYSFSYHSPQPRGTGYSSVSMTFDVETDDYPATNMHVLIGRNGVGKTTLLQNMSDSLLNRNAERKFGVFINNETNGTAPLFAGLVTVSFSAFDNFMPRRDNRYPIAGVRYSYVGLKETRKIDDRVRIITKSLPTLTSDFCKSIKSCLLTTKREIWKIAIATLETDPIFLDSRITALAEIEGETELIESAKKLFGRLSSGHKIVLLTLTRLVETLEAKSLVLLDEPEAHLHPPLLSSFTKALSRLLSFRNAVAIIATHSPVIVHEVPKKCVWILRRHGFDVRVERPEVESFAENIGVVTREVFGLETTKSGFYASFEAIVDLGLSANRSVAKFEQNISSTGESILRSMVHERDRDD